MFGNKNKYIFRRYLVIEKNITEMKDKALFLKTTDLGTNFFGF